MFPTVFYTDPNLNRILVSRPILSLLERPEGRDSKYKLVIKDLEVYFGRE